MKVEGEKTRLIFDSGKELVLDKEELEEIREHFYVEYEIAKLKRDKST